MRNGTLEQKAVSEVVTRIPESRSILRSYGIDPTNRLALAEAAAAVSVTPDALLAELEYRARRLARQRQHDQQAHLHEHAEELVV